MSQITKLSDIADIQLGMAFKSAIVDVGDRGNAFLIQMGDFGRESRIDKERLPQISISQHDERYALQRGDILLRLRGPVFTAHFFQGLPKQAVTNNQVAVIRANSTLALPGFLHWYLGSSACKRYFDACNEGTNIAKLNRQAVANTPLALPPLAVQTQISDIHWNWLNQKSLHQQLIASGDLYYSALCDQLLSRDSATNER